MADLAFWLLIFVSGFIIYTALMLIKFGWENTGTDQIGDILTGLIFLCGGFFLLWRIINPVL